MADKNDGKRLEAKFAHWLRTANKFDRTELRRKVRGASAMSPYEVDVAATRHRRWAVPLSLAAFAGVFAEMAFIFREHEQNPADNGWDVRGVLLLALEFALFGACFVGAHFRTKRVWAECKDLKDGVSRDHVLKLKQAVNDVKKYAAGWRPTHVYVVTANRFHSDALRLACTFGFYCYAETEGGFRLLEKPEMD